jgi:hypothetical protein
MVGERGGGRIWQIFSLEKSFGGFFLLKRISRLFLKMKFIKGIYTILQDKMLLKETY